MYSFKDARDMALMSHSRGFLTDEELLLLLEENNPEILNFRTIFMSVLIYKIWKKLNANLNSDSRS